MSNPLFLLKTGYIYFFDGGPTLALSRSGNTGISQPSRRRAPRVEWYASSIREAAHESNIATSKEVLPVSVVQHDLDQPAGKKKRA